ncbi:MAG TPA: hypothetical protein VL547_20790 [Dinghuibacter sp.]|uniref:hypothetical protein n=1 Tax=Dinghuibacter sp. TaxID=2024697 RepID=UPI002B7A8B78|nr:hypothetical protein [Dinghuibacter sp.]HTJ14494.1 hypothetical protein [Dinghuibacter sp.]
MKPFAVLCGAQLLLLGMTVRALLLPHAWGSGYVHEPWLLIVHSILTGVWVYSNLYMVRLLREPRWIVAALQLNLSVWAISIAEWLLTLLYRRFHEIGYLLRYYPARWIFWVTLGVAIFETVAFLRVSAPDIRRPFRQMGWNFAVSITVGLIWRLFALEHWPHPNYYSLIWTIHLPALLISIRLTYRFWRGDLARTAGWEREVETLGS